jgi:NitT/TauT family transport system permease protein
MRRIASLKRWPTARTWPRLADLVILAMVLAGAYALLKAALEVSSPLVPEIGISRSPAALPMYAAYSLFRIGTAYMLSLFFSIGYGYTAAYCPRAEKFMIAILDILQSIPVLSFLPGVMLALIGLFPTRQLGLELGAILLIFTGQAWNMAFSFYSSLKSIPRDLRDAAAVSGFSWWQRFWQMELPYAAIGLIWNSMMSVAGGWFFLMACEMFVLGSRDFRLPGLGSYLQTAASSGDIHAILWGVAVMVLIIVAIDSIVWKPLAVWSEKFKVEDIETVSRRLPHALLMLRRSSIAAAIERGITAPTMERLTKFFVIRQRMGSRRENGRAYSYSVAIAAVVGIPILVLAFPRIHLLLSTLTTEELRELAGGVTATSLRVAAALTIGAVWTIPAGVAIGLNPRLARVAQPLAQLAASIPATALFPVIVLALIGSSGGFAIASVVLMLLGTQWYILFNVIAGATAIPNELMEAARVCRFSDVNRWRYLILPAIFPHLVTGVVTAAGGAWNASIVAEYFHFGGRVLSTTGLGSIISRATDEGNFDQLFAATAVMVLVVVCINRVVWHRLYRLAETRFNLQS